MPYPSFSLVRLLIPLSVVLLGLNDHLWKGSGLLPSALTGKISDFAGLVVASAVLYLVLRELFGGRFIVACRALALLLPALALTAVNLSVTASDGLISLLRLVGIRWQLVPDPTDLWALGILPFAYLGLTSLSRSVSCSRRQRWRDSLVVVVGGTLCLASGPEDPKTHAANAFLHNATGETLTVQISYLKGELVDCEIALEDGVLLPADFEVSGRSTLDKAEVRTLDHCGPVRIVAWTDGDVEVEVFTVALDGGYYSISYPPTAESMAGEPGVAHFVRRDGRLQLHLESGLRHLELSDGAAVSVPEGCGLGARTAFSQNTPHFLIDRVEPSRAGCVSYISEASDTATPVVTDEDSGAPDSGDGGDIDGGDGGGIDGGSDANAEWDAGGADSGADSGGTGDAAAYIEAGDSDAGADGSGAALTPADTLRASLESRDGVSAIHVCSEVLPDLVPGDSITLSAYSSPGQRLRWTHYNSDGTRVSGHLATYPLSQFEPKVGCPQIRDECGAVWIAGRTPRSPPEHMSADVTLEAAWVSVIARAECPAEFSGSGGGQWLEVSQ